MDKNTEAKDIPEAKDFLDEKENDDLVEDF
jgi:hypothetical protein